MMRVFLALVACVSAVHVKTDGVAKVVELLQNMHQKITQERKDAVIAHAKFEQWSEDRIRELEHQIEVDKDDIERAQACSQDSAAQVQDHESKITDLAAKIMLDDKDMKEAEVLRAEQKKDFMHSQKELVESIDTLVRAASVLRRAGISGAAGTSAELKSALAQIAGSISLVMESAVIDGMGKAQLMGFVQKANDDDEDDDDASKFANPTAAAYTPKGGNIINILAELKVKAESELNSLRKTEMERVHAFQMLHQSLVDSSSVASRDLTQNKAGLSEQQEVNGKCSGDILESQGHLKEGEEQLKNVKNEVEDKHSAFGEEQTSRVNELKALAEAIAVLSHKKFVAANSAVDANALIQTKAKEDPRTHVSEVLKAAARKYHSVAMAQLALRALDDPFGKVKKLIETMISRLQKQGAQETQKKDYCDQELKSSTAKREDQSGKLEGFRTREEKAESDLATLESQIADLSGEIAELESSKAKLTTLRADESQQFAKSQMDFSTGIEGLNKALVILRKFYSEQASAVSKTDASSGVIAMLETAEGNMVRLQAESKMKEETDEKDYEKAMQDHAVANASKTATVKAKEGSAARLKGAIQDLKSDVKSTDDELNATMNYLDKLKKECNHKPQTFAERQQKMQHEIESLHEALRILDEESSGSDTQSFLQRK